MDANKSLKNKSEEPVCIVPVGYDKVLEDLKSKIKASQLQAMSAVNKQLIFIYRDIGRTIHEQQSAAEWGSSVVEHLAKDLRKSFPGMKGFSARNLWRMRDFYFSYRDNEKLTALLAEISWTHHLVILEQCKDPLEREFYIRMPKSHGWSYRVLMNQISNQTYEKTMTSQTNFDKNLPERLRPVAKLAMKDDYVFSFLELEEEHGEHELERAILSRIEDFLREVGNVYSFIAIPGDV